MKQQQQSPSLALLREMFPAQINIDIPTAAKVLGMASQSAYNLLSKKSKRPFPVRTFKQGKKRLCSILDLAATLELQRGLAIPDKPRGPGRRSNAENAERLTQQSASQ